MVAYLSFFESRVDTPMLHLNTLHHSVTHSLIIQVSTVINLCSDNVKKSSENTIVTRAETFVAATAHKIYNRPPITELVTEVATFNICSSQLPQLMQDKKSDAERNRDRTKF